MQYYRTIELKNHRGRIFFAGDTHGCYLDLMDKLYKVNFDRTKDHLFLLGDFVDRGPQVLTLFNLIREANWITTIVGNHERELMTGAIKDGGGHRVLWEWEGGDWAKHLPQNLLNDFVDWLDTLPIALEIKMPDEHRIGLVHAEVPTDNWQAFLQALDEEGMMRAKALENRTRFKRRCDQIIEGIDTLLHGHTYTPEPLKLGNRWYLDTGCGFNEEGKLTLAQYKGNGELEFF